MLGFIRPASSSAKASFKEMRKALRLSVPEVEDPQSQQQASAASGEPPSFKPSDVSFLYKGYAPLSIRLVETALSPLGWSPFAEVSCKASIRGRQPVREPPLYGQHMHKAVAVITLLFPWAAAMVFCLHFS